MRAESAATVIRMLNPKIRGWVNYYRHVVSSQIFSTIAHRIFWMTWRWAKRRHPNKSASWVKRKYFCTVDHNHWVFFGREHISLPVQILFSPTSVSIERHVKIKSLANPHDPTYMSYLGNRRRKGFRTSAAVIEKVLA